MPPPLQPAVNLVAPRAYLSTLPSSGTRPGHLPHVTLRTQKIYLYLQRELHRHPIKFSATTLPRSTWALSVVVGLATKPCFSHAGASIVHCCIGSEGYPNAQRLSYHKGGSIAMVKSRIGGVRKQEESWAADSQPLRLATFS